MRLLNTLIFIIISNILISGQTSIDTLYNRLTLEQKVSNLIVSVKDNTQSNYQNIDSLINKHISYSKEKIISALINKGFNEIDSTVANIIIEQKIPGFYCYKSSPFIGLLKTNDFFYNFDGIIISPSNNNDRNTLSITKLYYFPEKYVSYSKIEPIGHQGYPSILSKYTPIINNNELERIRNKEITLQDVLYEGSLIVSENPEKDIRKIIKLIKRNIIPIDAIKKSAIKNLKIKQQNKIASKSFFSLKELMTKLKWELTKNSILLLKNNDILPIKNLETCKAAIISLDSEKGKNVFINTINNYITSKSFFLKNFNAKEFNNLSKKIKDYNTIIITISDEKIDANNFNLFLNSISNTKNVILVSNNIKNIETVSKLNSKATIVSYNNDNISKSACAQIIFGGQAAHGQLNTNQLSTYGLQQCYTTNKTRLGYTTFDGILQSDTLMNVAKIAYEAIRIKATPGCQILIAKDGDVIYNRTFGYRTYAKRKKVKPSDIYDLASVTKVTASLPMIMKLYDEKKIDLADSLSCHLPRLLNTNKSNLIIKNILLHQAGLKAWIPFYRNTIDFEKLNNEELFSKKYSSKFNIKVGKRLYMNKNAKYRNDIYNSKKDNVYSLKVANNLYMNKNYIDSMFTAIDTSAVDSIPEYRYSDLAFYFMKEIIESKYNLPLNVVDEKYFYKPLGMDRTLFNPLTKFNKKEIIPTENDKSFRHQLLCGYVHDPGAAMMGGVAGHAGLFSNANDLAKIYQMYLNYGKYGDKRYIQEETFKIFTKRHIEGNRRAIGFDKTMLDGSAGTACSEASEISFGHSGFTGTLVWADPKYNLVYIFLSNRVNPNQYNLKLIKKDIRTRIQTAIYHSIPNFKKEIIDEKETEK